MDARRQITQLPESVPQIRRRPLEILPRSWAVGLALGWVLITLWAMATTPEPANPEVIPSAVDLIVSFAVLGALIATISSAAGRRPEALLWSAGLGLVWVATVISCPLTGHHEAVGWTWYVELVASGALLAASIAGVRRLRPR